MFRLDPCCSNKIPGLNAALALCPGVLSGGGGAGAGKIGALGLILGGSAGPAGRPVRIVEKQGLSACRSGRVAPALVAPWRISAVFQYFAKRGRQIASFATGGAHRLPSTSWARSGAIREGGCAPHRGAAAHSHPGCARQRPSAKSIEPRPDPQSALMALNAGKNREHHPATKGVGGSRSPQIMRKAPPEGAISRSGGAGLSLNSGRGEAKPAVFQWRKTHRLCGGVNRVKH